MAGRHARDASTAAPGSPRSVHWSPSPIAATYIMAEREAAGDLVNSSRAALWAVPGQAAKAGAGLLLFAYGDAVTLSHFLDEATHAARSFKAHNPELQIAVVTNNASVDRALFSHVLRPREDLLFRGSPCPYEKDPAKAAKCVGRPRQWATRLYYMALSPFALTWALDSNAVSCTPGAAGRFLAAAHASPPLWGRDPGFTQCVQAWPTISQASFVAGLEHALLPKGAFA